MSASPDRSRPPAPGPPRAFAFPDFTRRRLANGLELWLAPIDRVPLVDIQLVVDAGSVHDPVASPGLAHFTAAVIDEGTTARDSREIAAAVESLGGYLHTGAGWDTLEISCGVLSRHVETGLELVAEIARRPTFPRPETERLRGQLLAEIERRESQPAALADRHLMAAIYGDTVYGRPRIGTRDSLSALGRDDLAAFHHRYASPAGAALLLCGDFDAQVIAARIDELFGDWEKSEPGERPRPASPEPDGRTALLVDRPGAQTELRLGHPGPPRTHPDFPAATLLNTLLGGRFMSRINLNLRERHGYTYGASSYFDWRRGPGPFVVTTAVATEHAAGATGEILGEIERLRGEPVEREELEETRNYLIGVFPYSTERLSGVSAKLRQMAVHRLPDDYYLDWSERLTAVGEDEIQRAARTLLHPERLVVVAVGPAAELADGFAELGEVEVLAAG